MQKFKENDALEDKVEAIAEPLLTVIGSDLDTMLADADESGPFGDMIWESQRSPLASAIRKEIFRVGFKQIFESYVSVGTFEAYITVWKKIFGDSVDITFTVPGPGELDIEIETDIVELHDLVARRIESNIYLFDDLVDYNGDNILVQTIKGFQTQYELEQMLFEMIPVGVYTTISLSLL